VLLLTFIKRLSAGVDYYSCNVSALLCFTRFVATLLHNKQTGHFLAFLPHIYACYPIHKWTNTTFWRSISQAPCRVPRRSMAKASAASSAPAPPPGYIRIDFEVSWLTLTIHDYRNHLTRFSQPIQTPFKTHKCDPPPSYAFTNREELLGFYREMQIMRRMEVAADTMYKQKLIRGFLHLYNGQEAVAAGFESVLSKDDSVITAYRDHAFMVRNDAYLQLLTMMANITPPFHSFTNLKTKTLFNHIFTFFFLFSFFFVCTHLSLECRSPVVAVELWRKLLQSWLVVLLVAPKERVDLCTCTRHQATSSVVMVL